MSIDSSIFGVILLCLSLFVILIWKKTVITITFLRIILIIISIFCILINVFVENREDISSNHLNQFLFDYTFFLWPLLYILPIILISYDIYKFIQMKNKIYLYYFTINIILPLIANYNYNLFFNRFINS